MKKIITLLMLIAAVNMASAQKGKKTIDYLCFTAQQPGSSVAFIAEGDAKMPSLEYSFDQKKWMSYSTVEDCIKIPSAKKKKKPCIYVRGRNPKGLSQSESDFIRVILDGKVAVSGNIMTLIDATGTSKKIPCAYCFYKLFSDNPCLTSAPQLPATTLKDYCYASMFERCQELYESAELPAKTLAEGCYASMFMDCGNMRHVKPLPADKLAPACYKSMFENCISIATPQDRLPAIGAPASCYENMYRGCESITKAPFIAAPALQDHSCYGMFQGCQSLKHIKVALIQWGDGQTDSWVSGLPEEGQFECPNVLPEEFSNSRIPEGWEIVRY